MSELTIRTAVVDDVPLIHALICELAHYERLAHEVVATVDSLRESIFSPGACSEVLIAEWAGKPVGFALFFTTYSTFLAREGIYLEDLYVQPHARGQGIGKRLLAEVAQVAVDRQAGRLEWSVLDWNTPALAFYDSHGAQAHREWIRYRLTGDALRNFASANL